MFDWRSPTIEVYVALTDIPNSEMLLRQVRLMYPVESMTKASKGKEFTRNGSALPRECLDMRCFKAYQNATIGGSVEFPFLDENSPMICTREIMGDWGLMVNHMRCLLTESKSRESYNWLRVFNNVLRMRSTTSMSNLIMLPPNVIQEWDNVFKEDLIIFTWEKKLF